ncbi:polysaccharide synthesis protein GtrA [Serinicoccus sp. CNJ-927]|uniref:GtrA family protein n=1 Tax=Serinicoccus TaxID=265976 RepID=UPI0003B4AB98|nr:MULTISPECIES: GtrA family protein [Serinicoccus]OLT43464.1 polysaccharide synthesis protein GtrA [Serinicoccus sp. CNJ-927]
MRSLLRFVLVGVANTAVYYLLYRLLLLGMPYVPAHLLGWSGAVVFSFFANSLFTFGVRPTWRRFLAYPLTTVVNLTFTTVGSVLLVEAAGVDERYATLIMGIAAVPLTFVLTRYVLTAGREQPAAPPG